MLNAKTRCILYYRDIGYSKPKGGEVATAPSGNSDMDCGNLQ